MLGVSRGGRRPRGHDFRAFPRSVSLVAGGLLILAGVHAAERNFNPPTGRVGVVTSGRGRAVRLDARSPASDTESQRHRSDPVRSHQKLDGSSPPLIPSETPSDPGVRLPPLPAPSSERQRVERSVTPAPASPGTFNPDPGTPPPMVLEEPVPFFQPEAVVPPLPPQPAIAYPSHVYQLRRTIEPGSLTSDPYSVAPLDSDFADPLPRYGIRANEFIAANHGEGWEAPEDYSLSPEGLGYPSFATPVASRWEGASFVPWRRYTSGSINPNETPFSYSNPEVWHWYRQSRLKGDLPIQGQDWFLSLALSSETLFEDRNLPIPSGISSAFPGQFDFLGSYATSVTVHNTALDLVLLQGETVFKPPRQMFKVRLVHNYNQVDVDAPGILNPDAGLPLSDGDGESATRRKDDFFSLQEAFYEYHLADLSPNYDFISLKAGIQPFNSDFRGFIFNDTQLGVRLFGNQKKQLLPIQSGFLQPLGERHQLGTQHA